MNLSSASPAPSHNPWWTARRKLTALVIVHLLIACCMGAVSSYLVHDVPSVWRRILIETSVIGAVGILLGQITLLASFAAFSNQRLILRIPRFAGLYFWFLMAVFLGSYFVEGDVARMLVEELAALSVIALTPALVATIGWRMITCRRFSSEAAPIRARAYQFSTKNLLLITAEVAALLAMGRVVIRWNPRWAQELWNALSLNVEGAILAAAILTMLPVVFFGLTRQSRLAHLLLASYLLFCSIATACLLTTFTYLFSVPTAKEWFQSLGFLGLPAAAFHFGGAFTILCTFWLLRRIGYDFRRRDEERGGRGSSNARNSSASTSA